MSVDITLNKRKYRTRPIPKSVKNQSSGNNAPKRSKTKINWRAGSGTGDRNR